MSSTENTCTPTTGYTDVCGDPRGLTTFRGAQLYANWNPPEAGFIPVLAYWVTIAKLLIFPPGPAKTISLGPQQILKGLYSPICKTPRDYLRAWWQSLDILGSPLRTQTRVARAPFLLLIFDTQTLTEFTHEKVYIAAPDPQFEWTLRIVDPGRSQLGQ